jgi:hypothetical protein
MSNENTCGRGLLSRGSQVRDLPGAPHFQGNRPPESTGVHPSPTKTVGSSVGSPLTVAALVSGAIQLAWWLIHFNPPVVDFPIFYGTAKAMLAGTRPAYPGFPAWPGGPIIYALNAPHIYLFVAPFTALPLEPARWLWRGLTLACLGGAAAMSGVRLRARWVAAFLWCGGGTVLLLIAGQVGGLLALGMAIVCVAGPLLSGAALGFLVTFKPFLGLVLLLWLYERRWRRLAGLALGAAVSLLAGVLWVGVEPYREWVALLAYHAPEFNELNASWPAFVARVFGSSPVALWLGVSAIAAATAWAVRRTEQADRRLLIVLLASILLSPVGWAHYLWLTMVPLLWWLNDGGRFPAIGWLLWIPPSLAEISTYHLSGWTVPSFCFYGMIALWWRVSDIGAAEADTQMRGIHASQPTSATRT